MIGRTGFFFSYSYTFYSASLARVAIHAFFFHDYGSTFIIVNCGCTMVQLLYFLELDRDLKRDLDTDALTRVLSYQGDTCPSP
jgi:hypothetical protein